MSFYGGENKCRCDSYQQIKLNLRTQKTPEHVETGSYVLTDVDAFAVRTLLALLALRLAHRFPE